MNHLDCKLGWMKQQARIFASDSAWVTTAANVPSLKAWYRADTTVNAGGTVSQLTDKSGNGFHFVQATGTKQPALNVADANMGGRDSITADGTDDSLTLASPGFGSLSALTCFFVTRSRSGAAGSRMLSIGNTSIAQSYLTYIGSSNRWFSRYTNPPTFDTTLTVDNAASGPFAATSNPYIWVTSFDSAVSAANALTGRGRLGVLSSAQGSNATQASVVGQATALFAVPAGTSSYIGITLAELIICSAALTADQMRKVELYLAGYYGLL